MIERLYTIFKESTGVCTDTRKIEKGCLFFALKGANFDGNDYAFDALERGAKAVVIDRDNDRIDNDSKFIVNDALEQLQVLASYHRDQLHIPVIGLTGSNGKTTTKELIHAVLSKKHKVSSTRGNLNNHIGVPLTLLGISTAVEVAVVEMGANHQKEIEFLCSIAKPTHGLITNIGKAHLEGFGGIEGVKKGKGELYTYLRDNNGIVFINFQNETLKEMASGIINSVYYQSDNQKIDLESVSPFVSYKSESGYKVETQLSGEYNFQNIAAALAIGKYLEVDEKERNNAVSSYQPNNNRSQQVVTQKNELFLDAYNANPTSMEAAIRGFVSEKKEDNILVMGDMLELGEYSEEEHTQIVNLVNESPIELAFFCGKEFCKARVESPKLFFHDTKESLLSTIKESEIEGKRVFIKGSRGMKLETIIDYL